MTNVRLTQLERPGRALPFRAQHNSTRRSILFGGTLSEVQ